MTYAEIVALGLLRASRRAHDNSSMDGGQFLDEYSWLCLFRRVVLLDDPSSIDGLMSPHFATLLFNIGLRPPTKDEL